MLIGTVFVVILLTFGLVAFGRLLAAVHDGQAVTHRTLDTLEAALAGAPAAQDAAVRQLIGCPPKPARCPSMIQLLRSEQDALAELLSRPTRTVTVERGGVRTVVVTRTVVVCKLPNGRPCT